MGDSEDEELAALRKEREERLGFFTQVTDFYHHTGMYYGY